MVSLSRTRSISLTITSNSNRIQWFWSGPSQTVGVPVQITLIRNTPMQPDVIRISISTHIYIYRIYINYKPHFLGIQFHAFAGQHLPSSAGWNPNFGAKQNQPPGLGEYSSVPRTSLQYFIYNGALNPNYQNHLLITISSYSRMLVKSAACLVAAAPSGLLRTSQIPGGELGQWRGTIINLPRLWPFMLEQPGDVF